MNKLDTITPEYLLEQQLLHQNPNYGKMSVYFAPVIAEEIRKHNYKSISDYGAGKKRLQEALIKEGVNVEYFPYDPAFPEYGEPMEADLVCCIDVLEHIEPEKLDNVLKELHSITRKDGFFTVHTQAAAKTLSDGRNAHLIQEPASWWLPKIEQYFNIVHYKDSTLTRGFEITVTAK